MLARADVDVLLLDMGATDGPASLVCGRLIQLDEVARAVGNATAERTLDRELIRRRAANGDQSGIIAESAGMRHVLTLIDRAAASDSPVLLIGESGTGKELRRARAPRAQLARARRRSSRSTARRFPRRCWRASCSATRKGAFTDARSDQRRACFEAADGGTLFLDEIGDMPLRCRRSCCACSRSSEVRPRRRRRRRAGRRRASSRRRTATSQPDVAAGRFREDLFYRLNVVAHRACRRCASGPRIVPLLAPHFLEQHGAPARPSSVGVSGAAMERLLAYPWPGNVRELENVVERALVLGVGQVIELDDLPETLTVAASRKPGVQAGRPLADVEREHILKTLRAVDGNKSAAARVLGLDRKTLYRKIGRAVR